MIGYFDLHDMYGMFVAIRSCPEHPANKTVVSAVFSVLEDKVASETNQIRKAIRTVDGYESIFGFAGSDNVYTFMPMMLLKDERIYTVLTSALKELVCALDEANRERVFDLADCLHNLPVLIAEKRFKIPKMFWESELKYYRDKWNGVFLQEEQESYQKTG